MAVAVPVYLAPGAMQRRSRRSRRHLRPSCLVVAASAAGEEGQEEQQEQQEVELSVTSTCEVAVVAGFRRRVCWVAAAVLVVLALAVQTAQGLTRRRWRCRCCPLPRPCNNSARAGRPVGEAGLAAALAS